MTTIPPAVLAAIDKAVAGVAVSVLTSSGESMEKEPIITPPVSSPDVDALAENLADAQAALPKVSASENPEKKREKFNTILHESKDGTKAGAILNADGSYRRKRGRPPGSSKTREAASVPSVVAGDAGSQVDPVADALARRNRCLGKIRQGENVLILVAGERGRLDDQEREVILEPLIECDEKQLLGGDVDPRIALLVAIVLLVAPKILHPDAIDHARQFAAKFRRQGTNHVGSIKFVQPEAGKN